QPGILLALGARGDVAAFPVLADAARNRAGHMRLAAVQALGLLGCPKAVPVLAQAGRNASARVREAAVEALLAVADGADVTPQARQQGLRAARQLAVADAQKTAIDAIEGR
ncbi:MAG: HEAT repeat domain-containing protein, partial [Armatimonadota bacterium]